MTDEEMEEQSASSSTSDRGWTRVRNRHRI